MIVDFQKKKGHGFDPWPYSDEQGPWAALMACPWPLLSELSLLTEEGRLVPKAKKAQVKETNLFSSLFHYLLFYFFLEECQYRQKRIVKPK